MYTLQQMDQTGIAYNIPSVVVLEGNPDYKKLEQGFLALAKGQESLRTCFSLAAGIPIQRIRAEVKIGIEYRLAEHSGHSPEREKEHLEGIITGFLRPFDLSRAPLLRIALIKSPDSRHLLLMDLHHIICDGSSMACLIEEMAALYAGEPGAAREFQYKDYALWQHRQRETPNLQQQEAYWLRQFAGEVPVLNLPTDYQRGPFQGFTGSTVDFELEPQETQKIKTLAEQTGTTPYMVLLAIASTMLFKISGQEDIVIGTLLEGRNRAEWRNIIGMFVNTLALRSYPAGEKTFSRFLQEVKEQTLEAFAHQDYPFDLLVQKVQATRDMSRNPLFDVMFVFQNPDLPRTGLPGLKWTPYPYEPPTSKFDITLIGQEKEGKLHFTWRYRTGLFKEQTMKRYVGYFKEAAHCLVENPEMRLQDLGISHGLDTAKTVIGNVQKEFVF